MIDIIHCEKSERAVLGSCIVEAATSVPPCILQLRESDFFDADRKRIFGAIRKLDEASATIDLTAIHLWMKDKAMLTDGLQVEFGECMTAYSSKWDLQDYIDRLQERSKVREAYQIGLAIKESVEGGDDADEIIGKAQDRLDKLTASRDKGGNSNGKAAWSDLRTLVTVGNADQQEKWLKTGFRELDLCLNGLRPGRVYIVAARPGIGKSAFALNVARNLCQDGTPIGVISLEMSDLENRIRMLSNQAELDSRRIENGLTDEQKAEALYWLDIMETWPLDVCDTSKLSTNDLRAECRRMVRGGAKCIIIDYLQLAEGSDTRQKRSEQVTEISRAIKNLSKSLQVPIMALAQLNRENEEEPDLTNLRESGSIEQDADVVLMMYAKNEVTNPRCAEIVWKIAKNRQGPKAKINMFYDGPLVRFYEGTPRPQK